MVRKIVCLELLDGFEFEDFCAELFRKIGYKDVNVAPRVKDTGRDILMNFTRESGESEKIIVECKHYLKKTIGRSFVQKLHSAVVAFSANRGILITSGYFSDEAKEYTKILTTKIELIDLSKLKMLGEKAGFEIYETKADIPSQIFHVCKPEEIMNIIKNEIDKMISYPKNPSEIIKIVNYSVEANPYYYLLYSLNKNFKTSTGRIIHSIHLNKSPLLVDGREGRILDKNICHFLLSGETSSLSKISTEISIQPYLLNEEEIKEKIIPQLIELHTETVTYYGGKKRGRRYEKICKPSSHDIRISTIQKIYIPKWKLKYQALNTKYQIVSYASKGSLLNVRFDIERCSFCGKIIEPKKRVLCNECGKIGHFGFFKKHAFQCKECKKTLCRDCAIAKRKWLVLKRRYCKKCF